MRSRLVVVSAIAVLITSSAFPCPVYNDLTWYSDYFYTSVGWSTHDCDCSVESEGEQDGAYLFKHQASCSSGQWTNTCFQKVNGSWSPITCPPHVP
jgi:hypothetical protein